MLLGVVFADTRTRSITTGPLVVDLVPESSARYQSCVLDLEQARARLLERGVDLSETTSFAGRGEYDRFVVLTDSDGNNWAVREVPATRPAVP
jgi:hypothetical protein